jgi:hypothetical protein
LVAIILEPSIWVSGNALIGIKFQVLREQMTDDGRQKTDVILNACSVGIYPLSSERCPLISDPTDLHAAQISWDYCATV